MPKLVRNLEKSLAHEGVDGYVDAPLANPRDWDPVRAQPPRPGASKV
jgi:hypothetical protein